MGATLIPPPRGVAHLETLPDGRVKVTLDGDGFGVYYWTRRDLCLLVDKALAYLAETQCPKP